VVQASCTRRSSPRSGTIGANLDWIQIIKGWLDKDGKPHEKVYDVAWSGDRKPDAKTGKLPPVGDTVFVRTCGQAPWSPRS
jgi:hypothetical protein